MTDLPDLRFEPLDLSALEEARGAIAVVVTPDGASGAIGRRVDKVTRGLLRQMVASSAWEALGEGEVLEAGFPRGLAAEKLLVIKLPKKAAPALQRRAGAALARSVRRGALSVFVGRGTSAPDLALGFGMRAYRFEQYMKKARQADENILFYIDTKPKDKRPAVPHSLQGIYFTRDLTNEPANVLTTSAFAEQLAGLSALGVEVEILDEPALQALGMRALLAVGQGSVSPSKVVVMRWKGAKDAPLALIGKGVVFDTGGISLKSPQGMEEMVADMGGAGIVAGAMKTLALRKANAHVVGVVGLVENMPDGAAQRPGDIVRAMNGDTIEVINTDAEGRLVLADLLTYVRQQIKPGAMIDLATLTGAAVVALGHGHAAVFGTDDKLANAFLDAARAEDEGAWRMPLADIHAKRIKSKVADLKNSGGRPGGACTAAEFLHNFAGDDVPWLHIDVAGVAYHAGSPYAPTGATGWGVLSLDRLVRDHFEQG